MRTRAAMAAFLVLGSASLAGCGSEILYPSEDTTQATGQTTGPAPGEQPVATSPPSPSGPQGKNNGPVPSTCSIFPSDNPWNQDISQAPVDANSAAYIAAMNGGTRYLHPDFGSDPSYGIPWIVVPGTQPKVPMSFTYADESDPGPYPFPSNAPVEQGDQHVIAVDRDHCKLYETYNSTYVGPGWQADAGAVFDLASDALRPDGWTSADAAGLPIYPGLAKLSEADSGQINHALRFTVARTQAAYVHPATHYASSNTSATLPPMGLRVRLKASFDLSNYHGAAKVILTALKKYGMFLADNGSDWFISGETNTSWNDSDLGQLKQVPASAFEVVKLGTIYR